MSILPDLELIWNIFVIKDRKNVEILEKNLLFSSFLEENSFSGNSKISEKSIEIFFNILFS